jgi:hypothetical protein
MQQYDCPFIDTTADHEMSFSAFHLTVEESTRELETRMVVEATARDGLAAGLGRLRDHPNMFSYELVKRWGAVAHIRTVIDETDAMSTVRTNDGYITGPFFIDGGSEIWHVGFDTPGRADATLAELERDNDFEVISRDENGLPDFQDPLGQERGRDGPDGGHAVTVERRAGDARGRRGGERAQLRGARIHYHCGPRIGKRTAQGASAAAVDRHSVGIDLGSSAPPGTRRHR